MREGTARNPYYPNVLNCAPCLMHLYAGDHEEALVEAQRFAVPDLFWSPMLRASCLGKLGRKEEAQAAMAEVLRLQPAFPERCRHFLRCYIIQDDWIEHILDGLYRAGFEPTGGAANVRALR